METVNNFFASLPEWSLAVMGVSLGWVIGSALLYLIIEMRGGL